MGDNDNVRSIVPKHSHIRFIEQTKQLLVKEGVEKEGAISTIIITHTAPDELQIFASPKDPGVSVSLLAGAIDVWARSVLTKAWKQDDAVKGEKDGDGDGETPAA